MEIEIKLTEVPYGPFKIYKGIVLLFQALDQEIRSIDLLQAVVNERRIYPSDTVESVLGCNECPFRGTTATYSYDETEIIRPLTGQRSENPAAIVIGCDGMVSNNSENAVCKQRFSTSTKINL